jgi:hypothetical protein
MRTAIAWVLRLIFAPLVALTALVYYAIDALEA